MKQIITLLLAFLGIKAFQEEDGKKVLTDEQQKKIKDVYGEKFLNYAMTIINPTAQSDPGAAAQDDPPPPDPVAMIQQMQQKHQETIAKYESLVQEKTGLETTHKEKDRTIEAQKKMIDELSNKPVDDTDPIQVQNKNKSDITVDPKFLFGQKVPFMAIDDKHPYNQRAYAALMSREGFTIIATSSMDYSSLGNDLGDYYRIRKQDRIQSFVKELPSVEKIFPLESGYQDRAVLVNMFMEDMSQAWQNTFVVKGGFKFEPEEIRMYDVMFKHKFTKLKELEKQWIGYLNKEGSDAMKWSFIEYILAEAAKKLHNEREQRRIRGIRLEPTDGVAGHFLNGSNGVLKFLKDQIALYKIKTFALGEWTTANIVDYVFTGTMLIPAAYRDSGSLKCYMSTDAKIYYDRNFETLYGANSDYKGPEEKVKFIRSIPIVAVPNMGESKRIWWTFDGNVITLEDAPGEMYKINLEQEDETLKVWSIWKESVWAYMVGKKFASALEQDWEHQLIWCNDVDEPADFYVEMTADDTTPSVSLHTSLVSVANSQATALTNIDNATVGQEIRLKCGNATNAITIAKSGNFSIISAAWTPGVGDIIYLKKRSDGKFIEIKREDATSQAIAIGADDTTPDVSAGDTFITNANTQATAITTFDNASLGVVYTIYGAGTTNASTIANSGNFVLTAAMTLSAGTYIVLEKSAVDSKFYEISRG